jgi:hypothetical protein
MKTDKRKSEDAQPTAVSAEKDEKLRTAREIHTIAQLVYSHIASARPWAPPVSVSPMGAAFSGPAEPCGGLPPTWGYPTSWPW